MYHLQTKQSDDRWMTIDSGDDLAHLTKRRQRFQHSTGVDNCNIRITCIDPAKPVRFIDRDASGPLTFITLGLFVLFIAVVGLMLAG